MGRDMISQISVRFIKCALFDVHRFLANQRKVQVRADK
jgi:hypothetical protein